LKIIKELISEYGKRKSLIKKRLDEFKRLHKAKDEDIFQELCFCILTPQSKATVCDKAIRSLKSSGLLLKGSMRAVRNKLRGVRFPNNKAAYLIRARKSFQNGRKIDVKNRIDTNDTFSTREWLVENIKGLGYKEASHFLRNIGLGKGMAILDTHILKNLKRYGVINDIPKTLTKKAYIDIENRMTAFSEKAGIPMDEMDLLFWSKETGFIFK